MLYFRLKRVLIVQKPLYWEMAFVIENQKACQHYALVFQWMHTIVHTIQTNSKKNVTQDATYTFSYEKFMILCQLLKLMIIKSHDDG